MQGQFLKLLLGGISTTLMSFPVSMTYGAIAFLPFGFEYMPLGSIAGIFGAIISSILLAPVGSTSVLASGPRAASILIFSALCAQLLTQDQLFGPTDNKMAVILVIGFFAMALAGVVQTVAGLLRFGTLVKYIPFPVVSGFVNASVVLIILGQVWALLGMDRLSSFWLIFQNMDLINPLAFLPGLGALVSILLVKKISSKIPAPLIGLLGGTGIYFSLQTLFPAQNFGNTLASLADWVPLMPLLSDFEWFLRGSNFATTLVYVLPAALSMALMSSFDTVFSQASLDESTEKRTDANREMIANGIGNIVSPIFGGLNNSGGMNRTKPALELGITSPWLHMYAGVVLFIAVVSLSPYVDLIPQAAIAGMVIYVVCNSFNMWPIEALKTLEVSRLSEQKDIVLNVVVSLIVVLVALSISLIAAVATGTILAVVLFVARSGRSIIGQVARGPFLHSRKVWNSRREKVLQENASQIALVRIQGVVFFGTSDGLEDKIEDLIDDGVNHLILDMKRVRDLDISGARAMIRLRKKLRKRRGDLFFSYVKREYRHNDSNHSEEERRRHSEDSEIWRTMLSTGLAEDEDDPTFFYDNENALDHCERYFIEQHMPTLEKKTKVLGHPVGIIRHLSREDLKQLRPHLRRKTFTKDTVIFEQGATADAGYFLASGSVDIRLEVNEMDDTKLLESLTPGTVFGEMAILAAGARSARAVAAEDSICYLLDTSAFAELAKVAPQTSVNLLNGLCLIFVKRLRNANNMILELEN
jgi:SulP family sulfate permease